MLFILLRLLGKFRRRHQAVRLLMIASWDAEEGIKMQLRDDQKVLLTIQPVDIKNQPATLDGAPVWASSDATVITVEPAADGLSAVVSGVAPGTARVVVTANADLGSGVTPLTGTLEFVIVGGVAAVLNIVAATPSNQ